MECKDKHKDMIVLWGFSEDKCKECGDNIVTAHTPCNVICERCSKKLKLCEICGDKITSK